jgi:hypothetical protein
MPKQQEMNLFEEHQPGCSWITDADGICDCRYRAGLHSAVQAALKTYQGAVTRVRESGLQIGDSGESIHVLSNEDIANLQMPLVEMEKRDPNALLATILDSMQDIFAPMFNLHKEMPQGEAKVALTNLLEKQVELGYRVKLLQLSLCRGSRWRHTEPAETPSEE